MGAFEIEEVFETYCGVWHILDLLEKGADGWKPKFSY